MSITNKVLKLIAGQKIVESKLPKAAKLQLLEFVQNQASEIQLKSFMLDGAVIKQPDSITEGVIEDRFEASKYVQEAGVIGNLLGLYFAAPLWIAWRSLGALLSKAKQRCGVIRISQDRDACIIKAKMQMVQKKIELIKKASGDCDKAKNAEKCSESAKNQIYKLNLKIEKYKEKLQKLADAGRNSGDSKGNEPSKGARLI